MRNALEADAKGICEFALAAARIKKKTTRPEGSF